MSRINDALKRAQRAQRINPPPPGANRPRLLPAAAKPGNAIRWILPGLIGFLIVAACLFIGMAFVARTVTKAAGRPQHSAATPLSPTPTSAPVPAPATPPAPPPQASSTPAPPPSPPPPLSPTPPEPKLQGIVLGTSRPWAIVDGQTVHVGDRLGEFRVKDIAPRNITLEKTDGSQKKLGLDK